MSSGRILFFLTAAAFGFSVGAAAKITEPYFTSTNKIARCVAHHSAIDCHRDWIVPKRQPSR